MSIKQRAAAILSASVALTGMIAVTSGVNMPTAGAIDLTQLNVPAAQDCGVAGLHADTGIVSSCYDVSIQTEILLDGVDVAENEWATDGQVITVRLTVVTEGGQLSFYEEDQDGLKRNEVGGASDIRARTVIGLPTQTGTALSAVSNVRMSRTDAGDRGNAPGTLCSTQSLDEPAMSDALTAVALGSAPVGATDMSATSTGYALTAKWDDMAWDRCRGALSRNAIYPGHVVEFEQTVMGYGTAVKDLKWNLGQLILERDNQSRAITWGANSDHYLRIPADADGDGVPSNIDTNESDPCIPDLDAGTCDRDGDGQTNVNDPDPIDPCEISTGLSTVVGCDDDRDGVPDGSVPGSDGIPGVNGGQLDPAPTNPCDPDLDAGTCDRDGDGQPNSNDPDPTDPCEISTGLSAVVGCDDDRDGVPDGSVPGSDGIPTVNGGSLDTKPTDACVPSNTVGTCDRDGDGQPNSADPDPTDPCEISTGLSTYPGCDDDSDGVPSGTIPGSDGTGTSKVIDVAVDNACIPLPTSSKCQSTGYGYVAVTPVRIFDSRSGVGTDIRQMGPGESRVAQVVGIGGVPKGATAVVLNVTVTRATANTRVFAWATGTAKPADPTVQLLAGQSRPSMVIVPIGSNGTITTSNTSGSADVILDVFGYFGKGGVPLTTLKPTRVFDTRNGTGGIAAPFGANESRQVKVAGVAGVPTNARAVIVNATSTQGSSGSYLTLSQSGKAVPWASNVNWKAKETSPNLAIVPIGADGKINVYNRLGTTEVVLDIAGFVGSTGDSYLRPIAATRAISTSSNIGMSGAFGSDQAKSANVRTTALLPTTATGVVATAAITSASAPTYVTFWPTGDSRPWASTLNTVAGDPRTNGLIAKLGAGSISAFNYRGTTNISLSINGWLGPNR